jgi:hypothetical protein
LLLDKASCSGLPRLAKNGDVRYHWRFPMCPIRNRSLSGQLRLQNALYATLHRQIDAVVTVDEGMNWYYGPRTRRVPS